MQDILISQKLPGLPDSCWLSRAPKAEFPRFSGSIKCDVVVVGAGIVGLSTALSLLEGGRSVVVLEARQVGTQVTGRSTAKITSQHGLIYRDLIERLESTLLNFTQTPIVPAAIRSSIGSAALI
jgi:NADPH-dependent 2,4-dienoyl-CoA reductase/sulfur reductase-like enzyme